ncbi:DUF3850 domain-containing protein [Candidatus Falkowbacteria bacterium]|nr:DUF3850 domain-containing protein [Candidatus Falkowbacteria bacterium]
MRVEKKCWPKYFQKIIDGDKTFELRLADFDCAPGDTLALREWDPETEKYTGREIEKVITYVLKTKELKFWNDADVEKYGLQILSFK